MTRDARRAVPRRPAALLALAALLPWTGRASAHAFLATATPAVGATVRTAPVQVVIDFTEDVEPAFSTIAVQDEALARVDAGPVHLAGGPSHLAVGLEPLRPGTYTVVWHATATDTHRSEGRYTFTVATPPGATPPVATPPAATRQGGE